VLPRPLREIRVLVLGEFEVLGVASLFLPHAAPHLHPLTPLSPREVPRMSSPGRSRNGRPRSKNSALTHGIRKEPTGFFVLAANMVPFHHTALRAVTFCLLAQAHFVWAFAPRALLQPVGIRARGSSTVTARWGAPRSALRMESEGRARVRPGADWRWKDARSGGALARRMTGGEAEFVVAAAKTAAAVGRSGVSTKGVILLAVTIFLEICGATCLKLSQNFTNLVPSVLLFFFYAVPRPPPLPLSPRAVPLS
jgi:hypothetical protein